MVHLIVISIGGGTSQKPFHVVATILFLKFDIEGQKRNKSAFSILLSQKYSSLIFFFSINARVAYIRFFKWISYTLIFEINVGLNRKDSQRTLVEEENIEVIYQNTVQLLNMIFWK